MMRQRRRLARIEDFPELDELVLSEIEATFEDSPARVMGDDTGNLAADDEQERSQINREAVRPQPIHKVSTEGELFGDENQPGTGLLNQDEQRFIEDTAAYLRGRPNPDILIARIWSSVVESGTVSFHQEDRTSTANDQKGEDAKGSGLVGDGDGK